MPATDADAPTGESARSSAPIAVPARETHKASARQAGVLRVTARTVRAHARTASPSAARRKGRVAASRIVRTAGRTGPTSVAAPVRTSGPRDAGTAGPIAARSSRIRTRPSPS